MKKGKHLFMEDTTYKMLEQQEFWEKLNPELSINTNVFKKPVSDIFDDINNDFLHDDSCLDKASQTLNDEGYFKLDSIIPPNITDPLKKGIENLTNLGILPVFSMVYDEYWLVLKRLNSILTQILGKQWYALPDIWGWHIKKDRKSNV